MKIISCEQGSPEWFAARGGIATASEFSTILSKGKEKAEAVGRRNYRARLVVERLSGRPVSGGYTSKAMEQGKEREPLARAAYEVHSGNIVQLVGFCRHDEIECGASPDGLVNADGLIEIKCHELSMHLECLRRPDVPPEYRAQIQGELWNAEREWCHFMSFNPDFPEHLQLVVRTVIRDDAYIKQLEFMVRAFMDEVRAEESEIRALPVAA